MNVDQSNSGEFAPVSVVLRFHLAEELNEFRRLPDAIQKGVTSVTGIEVKAGDSRFSQPLDRFGAVAFQRIDAGNVIRRMVVQRILEGMLGENVRNRRFSGTKISF